VHTPSSTLLGTRPRSHTVPADLVPQTPARGLFLPTSRRPPVATPGRSSLLAEQHRRGGLGSVTPAAPRRSLLFDSPALRIPRFLVGTTVEEEEEKEDNVQATPTVAASRRVLFDTPAVRSPRVPVAPRLGDEGGPSRLPARFAEMTPGPLARREGRGGDIGLSSGATTTVTDNGRVGSSRGARGRRGRGR
jgi:hypothetical protein